MPTRRLLAVLCLRFLGLAFEIVELVDRQVDASPRRYGVGVKLVGAVLGIVNATPQLCLLRRSHIRQLEKYLSQ